MSGVEGRIRVTGLQFGREGETEALGWTAILGESSGGAFRKGMWQGQRVRTALQVAHHLSLSSVLGNSFRVLCLEEVHSGFVSLKLFLT